MSSHPDFREAMKFWFRLGFISFGGPAGQIAMLHEFLVEKKKWVSESKFLHALNYCMLLPGPEAQQMATYTGWLLHGVRGGIVAGLFFILPSLFILLTLSCLYVTFGNSPYTVAIFNGLKPAVVAIVIHTLLKISKKSLHHPLHYGIAIAAFIAIYFFRISFPVIILLVIVLAFGLNKWLPTLKENNQGQPIHADNETTYSINISTPVVKREYAPTTIAKRLIIALLLWALPFTIYYFFTDNFLFWKNLISFFTHAALITFGGAYAVLPYVAEASVEKFHWLSDTEMIDGLALGETTPGPLIMILAFVGFMAGYHQSGGSLLIGSMGLVTTTWYTFLPSFVLILVGAPLIERSQQNVKVKSALQFISAAVTGVILNLTTYLAKSVYFTDSGVAINSLIWTLVSLIALKHFNINMILWIGISALWGIILYVGGVFL
jgi:chromate transporter